jgi:hypothetical protein
MRIGDHVDAYVDPTSDLDPDSTFVRPKTEKSMKFSFRTVKLAMEQLIMLSIYLKTHFRVYSF